MPCAQNAVAKLQELSDPYDLMTASIEGVSVANATRSSPPTKFIQTFSSKPSSDLKEASNKDTAMPSELKGRPHAEYGEDSDVRLRKFAEEAEPGKCYTLEEIAEAMGVTRERVRQIEFKALRKLRHRLGLIMKKDGIDPEELKH
jgi:hypothetical protein